MYKKHLSHSFNDMGLLSETYRNLYCQIAMFAQQSNVLKAQNPQGLLHGILMTVGWIGCQQLAVWSLLLRNRYRKAIYIHGGAMLTLVTLVAISATSQVITKNWYHNTLGLLVSCYPQQSQCSVFFQEYYKPRLKLIQITSKGQNYCISQADGLQYQPAEYAFIINGQQNSLLYLLQFYFQIQQPPQDISIQKYIKLEWRTYQYLYTNISQFGKYYAVTASDTKTRLYTMVNFLHFNTRYLIYSISRGSLNLSLKNNQNKSDYSDETNLGSINGLEDETKTQCDVQKYTIPLLMKRYDKGQFTSVFLDKRFKGNIKISAPRGRGLRDLTNTPKPYKIFLFSGGTGIYPFADIVDIAFKQLFLEKQFISQKKIGIRGSILQNDPILQTKPFKDYLFTLYISVPKIDQTHPITLFQCQFLAMHRKMKIFLKSQCSEDAKVILQKYPHIKINNCRYQKLVRQLNQEQVSRIYICGPTRMAKFMLNELTRLYWSPRKSDRLLLAQLHTSSYKNRGKKLQEDQRLRNLLIKQC